MIFIDPKLLFIDPNLILSHPKLIFSDPKLILRDPKLIFSDPKLIFIDPKLILSDPKLIFSDPKVGNTAMAACFGHRPSGQLISTLLSSAATLPMSPKVTAPVVSIPDSRAKDLGISFP